MIIANKCAYCGKMRQSVEYVRVVHRVPAELIDNVKYL